MLKKIRNKMTQEEFKQLYMLEHVVDEEYELYRQLWDEYRVLTRDMGRSMSGECLKIHNRLFGNLPINKKYQKAKMDSLLAE